MPCTLALACTAHATISWTCGNQLNMCVRSPHVRPHEVTACYSWAKELPEGLPVTRDLGPGPDHTAHMGGCNCANANTSTACEGQAP